MHAAVVAAVREAVDATLRRAVVPFVATSKTELLVVLGAARDRAVRVNDQGAGTGHALT
jgi:hypothetical protein